MHWRVFPITLLIALASHTVVDGVWYALDETDPGYLQDPECVPCGPICGTDSCFGINWGCFFEQDPCLTEWTFAAEVIALKLSADGSAYGFLDLDEDVANLNTVTQSKRLDLKGEWKTGYRFTLGYKLPECCWGINFEWTHLKGLMRDQQSVDQPLNTQLYAELENIYADNDFDEFGDFEATASSKVSQRLHFNAYDLVGYARLPCCTGLALTPTIGIRGVYITDTLRSHFQQNRIYDFNTEPTPDFEVSDFKFESKYWGVGVVAGMQIDLETNFDFYLHGDGKFSCVYGKFKPHEKENFSHSLPFIPSTDEVIHSNRQYQSRWYAESAIGIGWHKCVMGYPIDLLATWQQILFFEGYINSTANYGFKGFALEGSIEF